MIRLIAGGRQTGRTSALVEWALKEEAGTPRYIVCHSAEEAHRVFREDVDRAEAEERPPIRMPITLDELQSYRGQPAIFAVDNLELILSRLLGPNVALATLPPPDVLLAAPADPEEA